MKYDDDDAVTQNPGLTQYRAAMADSGGSRDYFRWDMRSKDFHNSRKMLCVLFFCGDLVTEGAKQWWRNLLALWCEPRR